MTHDWESSKHERGFDFDYKRGRQGELFIRDIRESIFSDRIEVKRDERAASTGNVYIEFECKGRPSGLRVTEAELWAFVLARDVAVFTGTERLKQIARRAYDAKRVASCTYGTHPTRGVVIPVRAFLPLLMQDGTIDGRRPA